MSERLLVLAAVVAFFLLGLVLPVVRLWRRERVFGVVVHAFLAAGLTGWLLALLGWGLAVAFVDPASLGLWAAPGWLRALGWALVLAGLGLLMLAQAQMGGAWRVGIDERPTALVTRGLYRVVRNPIYSAISLMMAGLCAVTPSAATLAAWLVTTVVVGVQTRREEQHLLALHGAAYASYASRVGRFVPFLGRLSPRST